MALPALRPPFLSMPTFNLAAMAAAFLAIWFFNPAFAVPMPDYAAVHALFELLAVSVSLMIFVTGWNAKAAEERGRLAAIACAFLVVGLLDSAHMLSFPGMPGFITPAGFEKAQAFGLGARLSAAAALLFIAARPGIPARWRSRILVVSLALVVFVYWWVLYRPHALPGAPVRGGSPAQLRNTFELAIAGLQLMAASALWGRWQQDNPYNEQNLLAGIAALLFASLCFVQQGGAGDVPHMAGHLYKVVGYFMIYRAVFADSIQDPFARARQAGTTSRQMLQDIIDSTPAIVFARDLEGRLILLNNALARLYGMTKEQALGTSDFDVHSREEAESMLARNRQVLESGAPLQFEETVVTNGIARLYVSTKFPLRDAGGRIYGVGAVINDVTEPKRNEDALRLAALALENAAEGVVISRRGHIVSVNRAFCGITGYQADEVVGRPTAVLHAEPPAPLTADERRNAVATAGVWQGEIQARRKNGEVYPAWVRVSAVDQESEGIHYVSVFSDISVTKAAEARLEYLAHHDALTELPNRALMLERLHDMLNRSLRHGTLVALLYIDLDHFKPVNDSLGHQAGDELLRGVAQRLMGGVRKTDLVARLGGDEFVVLLDELRDTEEVGWIAQNLLDALARPFVLGGQSIYISASVGIACHPHDGKTAETLLRRADTAMYKAKEEGKNKCRFFSPGMDKNARERLFLTAGLRKALERDELALVYQPRVCVRTGQLLGVEALVRWHSPEHGLILPSRFIGLAEETGIIEPIGEWVLKTACHQLARWQALGAAPRFISVNLSARQFSQPKLAARVAAILSEARVAPECLELEITESVVMANPEKAKKILARLAELGVHLSLDDFGTGHSSLAYLQRFPVHHLKVDKSFIRELPDNRESAKIATAIVAMAKSLGLGVTAEGVETEAQRQFLAEAGCDAWQGYLFSEPVTAGELGVFLAA